MQHDSTAILPEEATGLVPAVAGPHPYRPARQPAPGRPARPAPPRQALRPGRGLRALSTTRGGATSTASPPTGPCRSATTRRRSGVPSGTCGRAASRASCSRRCSTPRASSRRGWWSSPRAGLRRVTFANSGAEAVEAAIKLCRAATGRLGILSTHGSFHGKTLGALSATGNPDYQRGFGAPGGGLRPDPVRRRGRPAAGPGRPAGPLRGLPRRADPGRGRHRGAAAGLPRRGPRDLHRGGRPAGPRRDPDRPGPHRRPVRLRGRGGRARRAGAGQGARRRARADRRRALHRGGLHRRPSP